MSMVCVCVCEISSWQLGVEEERMKKRTKGKFLGGAGEGRCSC